jgi:preprotein translocase subunit SecG
MTFLQSIVLVMHVLVAIAICGFVLLQHGKGADMGAAFGSGASGSLFGASGSANFLSRTTGILAAVFFLTSLGLTYFGAVHAPKATTERSIMDSAPPSKASDVPTQSLPATAPASSKDAGPAPAQSPAVPGTKSQEVPK